jgi:hypothetical protein
MNLIQRVSHKKGSLKRGIKTTIVTKKSVSRTNWNETTSKIVQTVENRTDFYCVVTVYVTTLSVAEAVCSIVSEYWRNEAAVAHLDIALKRLGKTGHHNEDRQPLHQF